MCLFTPIHDALWDFIRKGFITNITAKVIRELVMYWRPKGINVLPYLYDLLFLITVRYACRRLALSVEEDMLLAGLAINLEKSDGKPLQERLHLGFVVDLAEGLFKVPTHRWEALRS